MWGRKSSRRKEVACIVIIGAIIPVINTVLLRGSLINQVERIAKTNEENIIKQSRYKR